MKVSVKNRQAFLEHLRDFTNAGKVILQKNEPQEYPCIMVLYYVNYKDNINELCYQFVYKCDYEN